jgi:signal transduction histidine kinase
MELVFFIYGLAFFLLGFAITLYPKKSSGFRLADHLYLIAGFGIIHGINEWLDLFILILDSPNIIYILEIARAATLPVSFLCLIHFGAKVIPLAGTRLRILRYSTPFFLSLWLLVIFLTPHNLTMWDILARYLLCVPGALFAGWGLLLHLPAFKKTKYTRAVVSLKIAAASFFCYAFIAGLVVKPASFFPASFLNYSHFTDYLGIPVQVFRSICALTTAYGIIRTLSIFNWETKDRIRRTQLKFSTIASETPVIIFTADSDTTITFAEGKGLTLLDLAPDDIVGRTVKDAFADSPGIVELCSRALAGRQCISIEKLASLFFETCITPLAENHGGKAGLIAVAIDVTQQIATQSELDRYRDRMAETKHLTALGTMSDTMAKKLAEPLAATRVLLQRLTAELARINPDDTIKKRLNDSAGQVNHAIAIIEQFYSDAHITPKPVAEPIDLYRTVGRIISVFRDKASRASVRILTQGTDLVPCMKIPARHIEQVFFILIQYALDNVPAGQDNRLLITCTVQGGALLIDFADNYRCIPPDSLTDIFEPFFRLPSDSAQAKDTGIALAALKSIARGYGGDIEATSQKDHGTTFHVTLPVEHVY